MKLTKSEKLLLENLIDHEIEYLLQVMEEPDVYEHADRDIKELTKIKEKLNK